MHNTVFYEREFLVDAPIVGKTVVEVVNEDCLSICIIGMLSSCKTNSPERKDNNINRCSILTTKKQAYYGRNTSHRQNNGIPLQTL